MKKIAGLPITFWVVTCIAFINAASFTIIIPVIYPYAKEFGLSDFQASLLTTAYAGGQFIGTPILGELSDRFGRKPLLILSLLGTVVANIIASVSPFAWLLFVARLLDGLTGGNTSVARAIVSDITSPEQRTRAFGIFGATFRLGFVAGPPLSYAAQTAPPLPGVSSLGMSFLVAGLTALIATFTCGVVLSETHKSNEKQFSLSASDFGFYKIAQSVKRPVLRKFFLATLLSGFTFTIFTFAFQPFFLNVLGQEPKRLAIVFAAIGILGFTTQTTALDPLQKRFSRVNLLSITLAIRAVVFLLLPTFPNLIVFSILMLIFGIVNSFPMPIVNALVSLNSSNNEQGEVLGINAAYLSLANAVGPAVSGLLVSFGYRVPLWITGVLTLLVAGFALTLHSSELDRSHSATSGSPKS